MTKVIFVMRSGKEHVISANDESITAEEAAEMFFDKGFKLGQMETFRLNRFIFNPAEIESIEFVD